MKSEFLLRTRKKDITTDFSRSDSWIENCVASNILVNCVNILERLVDT